MSAALTITSRHATDQAMPFAAGRLPMARWLCPASVAVSKSAVLLRHGRVFCRGLGGVIVAAAPSLMPEADHHRPAHVERRVAKVPSALMLTVPLQD
jgi:hypothetical protein